MVPHESHDLAQAQPGDLRRELLDPAVARREICEDLEKLQGCVVEIVLKDISAVSLVPQRLWEWARIAREEAERSGK